MHRMAFGKGVGANEEATGCHVGGLSCLVWYHTPTGTIASAEPDATLARPHQSDLCMVGGTTMVPYHTTSIHYESSVDE